jgi:predicted nucleic acid-binding protein
VPKGGPVIVLDTNVLSELIRPAPEPKVLAWLEAQALDALFTTAISRAEMLFGVHILPDGRRRDDLLREVKAIFSEDLAGCVLAFDDAAADAYAEIAAQCRRIGRPSSQSDLMIAGIVRARGATLATRNGRDFEGAGITVVDPWR